MKILKLITVLSGCSQTSNVEVYAYKIFLNTLPVGNSYCNATADFIVGGSIVGLSGSWQTLGLMGSLAKLCEMSQ